MSEKIIFISVLVVVGTVRCDLNIPPGLKLGASTSASQIEGAWNIYGKGESIIDRYFHTHPEKENADVACNSYFLWEEDVAIAKELGLQLYRFSISWPRLLPTGFPNFINKHAKVYYNNLINELLENDIEPIVTLFHFDLPQNLQDRGGWSNPEIGDWLADYARVAYTLFGDRVKTWLTVNEPIITVYMFGKNFFPDFEPYSCSKNLLIAHAKAWRVYNDEFKALYNGQVSLSNLVMWYEPDTDEDQEIADQAMQLFNGLYSHPIYSKEGGWPEEVKEIVYNYSIAQGYDTSLLPDFTPEEIALVRGTFDFYALGYYSSRVIRKANPGEHIREWPLFGSPELSAVMTARPYWKTTPDEYLTVAPEGLRLILVWLKQMYGDIKFMITENGRPTKGDDLDDFDRVEFHKLHLEQVAHAIDEGVKVTGYCVWSLMDNFENMKGYEMRYGLYHVNFTDPNRPRVPRLSAHYYKILTDKARSGCSS